MPLTKEAKKLLLERGISGVSDPEEERALRVYVESEADIAKLPKEVAGMSVIPIVSGRFYALQFLKLAERTEKVRPAPGGVSIGHKDITAGTLGCVVRDRRTGRRVILSNNHVLANSNLGEIGDPILQPGPIDGGTLEDQIATLERFVRIKEPPATNLVDAAIALPLSDDLISDEILDVGRIAGTARATINLPVKKSGRTTGLTRGRIFDTAATIKVHGYPFEQ